MSHWNVCQTQLKVCAFKNAAYFLQSNTVTPPLLAGQRVRVLWAWSIIDLQRTHTPGAFTCLLLWLSKPGTDFQLPMLPVTGNLCSLNQFLPSVLETVQSPKSNLCHTLRAHENTRQSWCHLHSERNDPLAFEGTAQFYGGAACRCYVLLLCLMKRIILCH